MLQCVAVCCSVLQRAAASGAGVVASAPDEHLLNSHLEYKQYRIYVVVCCRVVQRDAESGAGVVASAPD